MLSLADYRQDMQQNHMKFFESVQNFQNRPASSSFSGTNFQSLPATFQNVDVLTDDHNLRARSGSSGSFFKDDLMDGPNSGSSNDDFPPISTFHVASPSPRKHGSFQQGPPRSNRFRRGVNFRSRNGNENSRGEAHHSQSRSSKIRHDSYSSNEGVNAFGSLTLQQQQAINNEAANGNNNSDFVGRYKTELCRPFMENGECKYGDKCQFAHGRHELKQMSRHPKYKTEYCRTFHTVGFCPYGPRCHFLHLLDLDNPAQQQDECSPLSSSDEQPEKQHFESSGRGESLSPTTIDEPSESVFMSPSPAAVSPVSSLSTCSEAAQSSGIGLSSPNASVSSTSPSARTTTAVATDTTVAVMNEPSETAVATNESSSTSYFPVDRLHLLTISTEELPPNFAQMQQQKRLQAVINERCLAFYRRQQQQQNVVRSMSSFIQPSARSFHPAAGRRLPIFSSLAN